MSLAPEQAPRSEFQFTVYNHESGINIFKVLIVLRELGLTYKEQLLDFGAAEHKADWYRKMVPNGRIPAIVDHWNGDRVVWESNAILLYITSRYDVEKKLLATGADEETEMNIWLFFQASHSAYMGQAQWFMFYHHETLPSAVERYQAETKRILSVLDDVLATREWLAGNKCTIADISFIKCNEYAIQYLLGTDFDFKTEFPHAAQWHEKLMARQAVKWVFKFKAEQQPCGRERQHVTGEPHSRFAARATGYARQAIIAQGGRDVQVSV